MWDICEFISLMFQVFGILLMLIGLAGSIFPETRKVRIVNYFYKLFYFDIEEELKECEEL